MLRSLEITAALSETADEKHRPLLHWERRIELSLDCFVCERVRRTTVLEWGAEKAVCSSGRARGPHFTAARIASFDVTGESDRLAMRSVVDFWWAPFHDAESDARATALSDPPWVRLHLGYRCPHQERPGAFSVQSNLVRPARIPCAHCETRLAVDAEAPAIRLLT